MALPRGSLIRTRLPPVSDSNDVVLPRGSVGVEGWPEALSVIAVVLVEGVGVLDRIAVLLGRGRGRPAEGMGDRRNPVAPSVVEEELPRRRQIGDGVGSFLLPLRVKRSVPSRTNRPLARSIGSPARVPQAEAAPRRRFRSRHCRHPQARTVPRRKSRAGVGLARGGIGVGKKLAAIGGDGPRAVLGAGIEAGALRGLIVAPELEPGPGGASRSSGKRTDGGRGGAAAGLAEVEHAWRRGCRPRAGAGRGRRPTRHDLKAFRPTA